MDTATAPKPSSIGVTCPGSNLVAATMDYIEPPDASTIESAIEPWIEANPDLTLEIEEHKRSADVYLVRPDGSVAAVLNTLRFGSNGWALNTFTSCPGIPPFGR